MNVKVLAYFGTLLSSFWHLKYQFLASWCWNKKHFLVFLSRYQIHRNDEQPAKTLFSWTARSRCWLNIESRNGKNTDKNKTFLNLYLCYIFRNWIDYAIIGRFFVKLLLNAQRITVEIVCLSIDSWKPLRQTANSFTWPSLMVPSHMKHPGWHYNVKVSVLGFPGAEEVLYSVVSVQGLILLTYCLRLICILFRLILFEFSSIISCEYFA